MPVLIAIVVLSLVAGLVIRRAAAIYLITATLSVLANFSFVWAIADGKGNDPWYLILMSLAASGVAFAAAWAGLAIRRKLASAPLRVS